MSATNIFKNGGSLFTILNGGSLFTILCIRNRHRTPSNIIISTQSMMTIPKTIRLNANSMAQLKFSNKNTILDDIYPTMSAFIIEEQFKNLYDYAVSKPHDAFDDTQVIDDTQRKRIF